MNTQEAISQGVKNARIYTGLSQKQVSEQVSISRSSISKMENGEMAVDIELVMFYYRNFNIPLEDIMTGKNIDEYEEPNGSSITFKESAEINKLLYRMRNGDKENKEEYTPNGNILTNDSQKTNSIKSEEFSISQLTPSARFIEAFKYLQKNKLIKDEIELSENIHLPLDDVKSILNGKVENEDLLDFGIELNILEIKYLISADWILFGEGKMIADKNSKINIKGFVNDSVSTQEIKYNSQVHYSQLFQLYRKNEALRTEYESLKKQLEDKEERIREKEERIKDKEERIKDKEEIINDLKSTIRSLQVNLLSIDTAYSKIGLNDEFNDSNAALDRLDLKANELRNHNYLDEKEENKASLLQLKVEFQDLYKKAEWELQYFKKEAASYVKRLESRFERIQKDIP